jgi:hypothetical protein
MDYIIDRMNKYPFDITWLGIGSALIRDTELENMQQFPPFLQKIYNNTNLTIRIINIDSNFENPYLLTTYLENLNKIDENNFIDGNIFIKDRLEIIYANHYINFEDLEPFDKINQIILNQQKLLIVGIFTGHTTDNIEKYFQSKYDNNYDKYITYNFNEIGIGECFCNLLENYPIIDLENNRIIKLNNIQYENIINKYYDIINTKSININETIKKFKRIILNELKTFINLNYYVLRNLKNKEISEIINDKHLLSSIDKSIFINIDINNYEIELLITSFNNHLMYYNNIFRIIFNYDYDLQLNIDNTPNWYNKVIASINLLR